jgi:hypothetical protein
MENDKCIRRLSQKEWKRLLEGGGGHMRIWENSINYAVECIKLVQDSCENCSELSGSIKGVGISCLVERLSSSH